MKLLGTDWTPKSADQWTRHDLVAAVLSPIVYVLVALGGTLAAFGQARGWWLLLMALGASLLLWAVIDRKLRAQSVAFLAREKEQKRSVDERNRWEDP